VLIGRRDRRTWLVSRYAGEGEPQSRLVCFPHAGGGMNSFQAWRASLSAACELVTIKYPGRDTRWSEPLPHSLPALAGMIAGAVVALLDRPTVFYGHSMGALLAFEVARRLPRQGLAHLFVAAHPAPHLPYRGEAVSDLPAAELVERLRAMGGTPDAVLADAELLELLLPAIRADFAMCERYRFEPGPPLTVPITALGGDRDAHVAPGEVAAWREHTSVRFAHHRIAGGHFFSYEDCEAIVGNVEAELPSLVVPIRRVAP